MRGAEGADIPRIEYLTQKLAKALLVNAQTAVEVQLIRLRLGTLKKFSVSICSKERIDPSASRK